MKPSQLRGVLALLALVLLVALGLLWRRAGEAADTASAPEPTPLAAPVESSPSAPEAVADSSEPSRTAPREEPAAEVASPARDGLFRVRVLHHETLEPLAGAEVRWAETSELSHPTRSPFVYDPDFERIWSERSHSVETDASGVVWLPQPKSGYQLEATHAGLWGFAWAYRARGDRCDLVVHPDRELLVQVVESSGAPAAGVGVLVQPAVGVSQGFMPNALTGPDGIARIRRLRGDVLADNEPVRVRACAPNSVPVERVVPTLPWPSSPVRMELPATGSILLRLVEPSGARNLQSALVSLMAARDSLGFQHTFAWAEEGQLELEHVALGDTYSFSVSRQGTDDDWSIRKDGVLGPRTAGERVEVELAVERTGFTLVGRAVRPDGSPIVSAPVTFSAEEGAEFVTMSETDATGAFRLSMAAWRDGQATRFSILIAPERLEAKLALPEHLSGQRIDLGVVRLEELPVVLRGRVLDTEGRPIEGAVVMSEVRPRGFDASKFPVEPGFSVVEWSREPRSVARTGSDGRYVLAGAERDVDRRCRASAEGFQESKFVELAAEEREHDFVLKRHVPRLVGRVLIPSKGALQHLRLRCSAAKANWLLGGSFELVREQDGPVDLEFFTDGESLVGDAPLVRLEGLESTDDPRLDGIDLRPFLREFRCEILSPPDAKFPRAKISAALPGKMIWSYESGPSVLVLMPAALVEGEPLLDLHIVPERMRPVTFERVAHGAQLDLLANTQLSLRVPDQLPAASGDLVYSIVAILANDDLVRTRIVEGRTATLRIPKDGRWRVIWELEPRSRNLMDVELEIGRENLECVLDTTVEAIEAELAKVRAARK